MLKVTPSEVIAVIEVALQMQTGSLRENTRAEEVASWDSLGQLSILVGLDKLFCGKIASLTEMAEADSVSKILSILSKNNLV
jgi:hypothetical protein